MNTKQLICCAVALFPSVAGSADATVGSQVPLIVRELCKAKDLLRPFSVEFQANIALSRWHRSVFSWEKGQLTSLVQEYRYSSAAGGNALWFEARQDPGRSRVVVNRKPFFIGAYQNRNYMHFFNDGRYRNGLIIRAGCVFQAWATDARLVGNIPSEFSNPTGPWERILAYNATPLQNAGMPPCENGDARTGPTQDEYRKVPFRLSGGTYFTLPGKNRHFGSVLQLLNFDPLMVPDPVSLGWVGGVDPSVAVIPDPSLKESPLPGGSMKPARATEAELESE